MPDYYLQAAPQLNEPLYACLSGQAGETREFTLSEAEGYSGRAFISFRQVNVRGAPRQPR